VEEKHILLQKFQSSTESLIQAEIIYTCTKSLQSLSVLLMCR